MQVAVVGGKLQGVEAVYLARKAGWETLLVDRTSNVPAMGLCNQFFLGDVNDKQTAWKVMENADLIIPALENDSALASLAHIAEMASIPLAFDPAAYSLSASKVKSNRLFSHLTLPTPLSWPACDFPVMVKPDGGSGSTGVRVVRDAEELGRLLPGRDISEKKVIQEFVPGPTYSLEVIGRPGSYATLQVTDLSMDRSYDCKRVCAPSAMAPSLVEEFEKLSIQVASQIRLRGIMDMEVVLSSQGLKILEIDARLPSQTPTVVYWSTGVNMLELLKAIFVDGSQLPKAVSPTPRSVLYEHISISPHTLDICGEHIMAHAGPLQLLPEFFGSDEALTNYRPGRQSWQATMIYAADNRKELQFKRNRTLESIRGQFRLSRMIESIPDRRCTMP